MGITKCGFRRILGEGVEIFSGEDGGLYGVSIWGISVLFIGLWKMNCIFGSGVLVAGLLGVFVIDDLRIFLVRWCLFFDFVIWEGWVVEWFSMYEEVERGKDNRMCLLG